MAEAKPLVLDVDGTFLRTDMLFECFWAGLGKDPLAVLGATARFFTRPAKLKRRLAEIAKIRTELLPVNEELKALALNSIKEGRDVYLASASDQALVDRLALDHGIKHPSLASNGERNLKGRAKAAALIEAHGENGFDYAGDAHVDLSIWEKAENALVVGHPRGVESRLSAAGKNVVQIPGGWRFGDLMRALRPHQWVKNILLFLPMIAAHQFGAETFLLVLLGMAAFSAAASSIYIINDLLDLEADRLHPTKCRRPFASGAVPIRVGMITFAVLILLAFGLGAALGGAFLGVIAVYITTSLAYSLKLKRMRWIDIATLAALYTLRVVAGAVAGQVVVSTFMLIFVFPVFVALGCVKRLTELTLATSDERLPGRGYGRPDRGDLLNVAGLGTFGALLIFFLYSFSEQATALYPTQWLLWVAIIPLATWLIRMVWLGYTGKQDYDPIVFAMRDKTGIGILLMTLSLMFYAAGLWNQWFGL